MKELANIEEAEKQLLKEIRDVVKKARIILADECLNISQGTQILQKLRKTSSEKVNQIQHERILLEGIKWIKLNTKLKIAEIYWNPRQTGTAKEPDLQVMNRNGSVIISAEATSSEVPQGVIDSRMSKTLQKLNELKGRKLYFVPSAKMANRARSKIAKKKYDIEIVQIETPIVAR